MKRLEGKVFLGYGTGAGMGRAAALLFAQEGAKVVVASNPGNGQKVVEEIRAAGGEAIFVATNCMLEKDIENAVEETVRHYGRIDIMLYQPGSGHNGAIIDSDIDAWKNVFELNTYGPARAIKAAGKRMKAQGSGSIVITASVSAICPSTENACYGATKAAVNQIVRVAAMELGPEVRVNSINPGLTATKAISVLVENKKATEMIMEHIPMKRYGQPEDIAKAALFLASDDASYITGIDLTVDGGIHFYGFPDWLARPDQIK